MTSNYGAVFFIWDWLFGALREQEPVAITLEEGETVYLKDIFTCGFGFRSREVRLGDILDHARKPLLRGHYPRRPA